MTRPSLPVFLPLRNPPLPGAGLSAGFLLPAVSVVPLEACGLLPGSLSGFRTIVSALGGVGGD